MEKLPTVRVVQDLEVQPRPRVGAAVKHPDGRIVYVYDGQYEVNGRISNFWYWRPVLEDGTLGEKESGYGW